jgi:hypothetical protein
MKFEPVRVTLLLRVVDTYFTVCAIYNTQSCISNFPAHRLQRVYFVNLSEYLQIVYDLGKHLLPAIY